MDSVPIRREAVPDQYGVSAFRNEMSEGILRVDFSGKIKEIQRELDFLNEFLFPSVYELVDFLEDFL